MWAIKTIWTIFIWLLVAAIFSFEPFNFNKFWDIVLKAIFILLFIVVIVFEVKDWKSRNKEK